MRRLTEHSGTTPGWRAWTVAVACIVLAACGGGSPGADGGTTGAPSGTSGTDSTPARGTDDTDATSATDDEPLPPSVEEVLALPFEIVEPVVAPALSVSGLVSAASGGTVRLDVPASESVGGWSATLVVPAGAVESDVTVTLMAVESVGGADAASGWRGVEIQPSGLVFPADAVPRLTFTGVPEEFLGSAVGWDSEGVVEPAAVAVDADGSVVVAVPHFSGYGGGDPDGPGSSVGAAQEVVRATLGGLLREVALAQGFENEDAEEVDTANRKAGLEVMDTYIEEQLKPLIKSGTRRCGPAGRRAVDAYIWASQQSLLLGGEFVPGSLIKPVILKQLDCARKACAATRDPASAGQFWWALEQGAHLPEVLEGDELNDLVTEGLDILRRCATWRLTVTGGVRDLRLLETDGAPLWEGFRAEGLIPGEGEVVVPMSLTSNVNDVIASFIRGWRVTLSGDVGQAETPCDVTPYGRAAMRVTLSSYRDDSGDPPETFPEIRLVPYVTPATTACGDSQMQESIPSVFVFATVPVDGLDGFTFDGKAFVHRFTEAERAGSLYAYGAITEPGGIGVVWLTVSLEPATMVDDPPVPPDTAGLVDVAERVAQIRSRGGS